MSDLEGMYVDARTVELVIDDVDPAKLVSANRRIHHHHRADVQRHWRTIARDVAHQAYGHADEGQTWHQRVRILITYRFPDRRRHDTGNLYSYVAKPIVDGLVDARVVPDDDDLHVQGPDPRRDFTRGPHRITITIQDLP